mmetsp:Transcript_19144/g.53615  ORF Transcript_19144/g.53615 Transcript_19144/m.53615 type:complete len:202 (+) Transcript_19144:60-665(+)
MLMEAVQSARASYCRLPSSSQRPMHTCTRAAARCRRTCWTCCNASASTSQATWRQCVMCGLAWGLLATAPLNPQSWLHSSVVWSKASAIVSSTTCSCTWLTWMLRATRSLTSQRCASACVWCLPKRLLDTPPTSVASSQISSRVQVALAMCPGDSRSGERGEGEGSNSCLIPRVAASTSPLLIGPPLLACWSTTCAIPRRN